MIAAKPRPPFDDVMDAARVSSFMGEHEVGRWKTVHFTVTERDALLSMGAAIGQGGPDMEARIRRTIPPGDYICLKRRTTPEERADIESGALTDSIAPGDERLDYTPIMSDTPEEINEHGHALENATGHVLITGLGLGVLVSALLAKPCSLCKGNPRSYRARLGHACGECGESGRAVKSITVVEIDRDVIDITGPYYENEPRVTIINADALSYARDLGRCPACGQQVQARFPRSCPTGGTCMPLHSRIPDGRYDYAWHDIWSHISDRNLDDDSLAEHGISYSTMFAAYAPYVKRQGAWAYPEAAHMREVHDRVNAAAVAWGEAMLNGSREERIALIRERIIIDSVPTLNPGDTIPEHIGRWFDANGVRERAEATLAVLNLDDIRRVLATADQHDPMARPNEAPEANVAPIIR